GLKACLQDIGNDNECQSGKECRDDALYQHSCPGHFVGIHFTHECWQTAVQAGDKEQPPKRVVVDSSVKEEEANENEVDNGSNNTTSSTKPHLHCCCYRCRTALTACWCSHHHAKRT